MPINKGTSSITGIYVGSNEVIKAYVGSDLVYSKGGALIPITDLNVGDSVYLKETGVLREYIIVQKGRPSTAYDASCDGIWLMRKELYKLFELPATQVYGADNYICNYTGFEADTECVNFYNTELFLYDSIIINATIPSRTGAGSAPNWNQQNATIQRKCFLLSAKEMGFQDSALNICYPSNSAKLSYFGFGSLVSTEERKGYYNGSVYPWITRSTQVIENADTGDLELRAFETNVNGWFNGIGLGNPARNTGLRPCIIASNAANIREDTHELMPTL